MSAAPPSPSSAAISASGGSPDPMASVLPALTMVQSEIDAWYHRSHQEMVMTRARINDRIDGLRRIVLQQLSQQGAMIPGAIPSAGPMQRQPPRTPPMHTGNATPPQTPLEDRRGGGTMQSDLMTPPPGSKVRDFGSPPAGSEKMSIDHALLHKMQSRGSNSPPINFDSLYEQLVGKEDSLSPPQNRSPIQPDVYHGGYGAHGGGGVNSSNVSASAGGNSSQSQATLPIDVMLALKGQRKTQSATVSAYENGRSVVSLDATLRDDEIAATASSYHVLVEFKRHRVLHYEAPSFYPPGCHVVVAGDRGEDIGLVIYVWVDGPGGSINGLGLSGAMLTRNIGIGNGRVMGPAQPQDVSQLLGMQAELERRAVDVCRQRVLEHGVPMVIVDAEYQFDKKKLTFFYESQQRLDFRDLVRDLFKTFRARIWMEPVQSEKPV